MKEIRVSVPLTEISLYFRNMRDLPMQKTPNRSFRSPRLPSRRKTLNRSRPKRLSLTRVSRLKRKAMSLPAIFSMTKRQTGSLSRSRRRLATPSIS